MIQNNIHDVLQRHKIIPVVTLNNENEVDEVASKLLRQDIHCAEITLRTEFALEGICMMMNNYPEIDVGVGTIVNSGQVELVKALGVKFIVSPGASPNLLQAMQNSGIPFLPGVVTPSEVVLGMEANLLYFKFFPANLFGGLDTLRAYGQVFPQCYFCPTGGLNADNYQDFLNLKNVLSVGGSWMIK
jgi:2-dehydro-3-deoxyphosphogluconate aldolase/(4S)-4-hydroxy-2-oxoglutarate aldolase